MSSCKGVTVLGSTGTIGVNTLDVLSRHPEKYQVIALTANTGVERLYQQCIDCQPQYAAMADAVSAEQLEAKLKQAGSSTQVLSGVEGLEQLASLTQVDYVMAAIVGAAGLLPTLAAARAGKRVLLANKEALVMSGSIFMDEIRNNGAELLPIDSEHNAIFQCMPNDFNKGLERTGVDKILLTASGGPFRSMPVDQLKNVTPEQAVAHPNWVMGRKISVDSATMMNKGLEVIEACWLFETSAEKIQVVIHPQSVIHSMVSYNDGSVLAQMGNPDMRTPIAHALGWPERIQSGVEPLDVFKVAQLEFEKPDINRFPCLKMAYESLKIGGTATTVLNAANEIAVDAFLNKKILFTDIARVVEQTLEDSDFDPVDNLEIILSADKRARQIAEEKSAMLGAL
ncbi:MAG: 1-deoxy-D-xylulose-5-phosphate reductoisomerase [Gammaproteobacteria bacterium]|nr:1-deoxy-D-xylulose-5-phosphate reductoisomerase [Gammaproteobacteria bacterium]MCW8909040.1 1-deoxy-D-xylulose-5-phosphate reductoisomerase [Gammaproteobacteria bacterium]MCW9004763.1 1-deoxy-D-xylulose-5-phosphate reductoisomerase [Gammaproteobacteria bacterium]MCW9055044.1 1-deoxy-D-xylulose-5-phosphate reductoisomerase [Gammaproteobacteria bacterium]